MLIFESRLAMQATLDQAMLGGRESFFGLAAIDE